MRPLAAMALLILVSASADAREPRSARLFDQWQRADVDRNGALSRIEASAMPSLAPYFDAIDRDGNGEISADEVRAWRSARRSRRPPRQAPGMTGLFEAADSNGDRALSRKEVELKWPRLARNFEGIDADHDGMLSRAEIDRWLARRRPGGVK
jgi:Ca2+-binding EF-hand superfamily protein